MKATTEALQLRHRLIQNFEDALGAKNDEELQQLMNIVVVGGGPTGVEVSGALAEMRNNVLPKDYPELDFKKMKIFLIENSPKTLGTMSEKSSEQSRKYLEKLGVEVRTGTMVKTYDGNTVTLGDGSTIKSEIVIWAAGIKGNVPAGIDPSLIVRGNRIKVDRENKVLGMQNVYAIGDIAYMETPLYPHGHPQLANVAISQGKNLATNLIRQVTGNKHYQDEYEYHDKGSMATVGRNLAVVDIPKPKLHFGGFLAWLVWMLVHLVLILGVKNRLQIFINWIYKYFTYDQSLRLLFKEFYRPKKITACVALGMLTIELLNLHFYAYHGVYEEEKICGGNFKVNVKVYHQPRRLPVLHIAETIDYTSIYALVKALMKKPEPLLETVATMIATQILEKFPEAEEAEVYIIKINPPIFSFEGNVAVNFSMKRNRI